jgi:hypothetical protein
MSPHSVHTFELRVCNRTSSVHRTASSTKKRFVKIAAVCTARNFHTSERVLTSARDRSSHVDAFELPRGNAPTWERRAGSRLWQGVCARLQKMVSGAIAVPCELKNAECLCKLFRPHKAWCDTVFIDVVASVHCTHKEACESLLSAHAELEGAKDYQPKPQAAALIRCSL